MDEQNILPIPSDYREVEKFYITLINELNYDF